MRLSVVVPCHNEQAVLPALYAELSERVPALVAEYELVFVDDGSRDGTLEVLRELAGQDEHVRFVSFSRNFGKEAAIFAGLREATGDAVVLMDADLQHPPSLIGALLAELEPGVDQVIAERNRAGDPWLRTVLSRLYYRLMGRATDVPLSDGQGDFRLLSRRAVDSLLAMPESNRFSKGLFSWIGFERRVVKYDNAARAAGASSWSFGRLLNYGMDGVVSFNSRPLRILIWVGLTVALVSLAYAVVIVVQALTDGVTAPGYVTLLVAITALGGMQLVSLGVIGEYIGRIYQEVKRRPPYIVRDRDHERVDA